MNPRAIASKIVPFSELKALADDLRSERKPIVTTNGCFDLLHWGHLQYLAAARDLGGVLICGINSDLSVKSLNKGEDRPLVPEKYRALQLAALESVDWVSIFNDPTPEAFLEIVRPAVHVKGGDYTGKTLPEQKVVERHGGKIVLLPLAPGFSTTALIQKIRRS